MPITAERCCDLLADALQRYPQDVWAPESVEWFADALAIVEAYGGAPDIPLRMLMPSIADTMSANTNILAAQRREKDCMQFRLAVLTLHRRLQLETRAFTTAHIPQGNRFDYFEEIRGKLVVAQADILFCDPYISADFVPQYLPIIPQGVRVRLLSTERFAGELEVSCRAYRDQHGWSPDVRVAPNRSIHDRHLVVDQREVWQSGASFKDGPRNAGTTINQIVDTATVLIAALEQVWGNSRSVP